MLEESPTPWGAIEAEPEYGKLDFHQKASLFAKWDTYSRQYATERGLWDDEGFRKEYETNANQVMSKIAGVTPSRQVAIDAYNLTKNIGRAAYRGWLQGTVADELQKPTPDTARVSELQAQIEQNAASKEFQTTWDEKVDPKDSWAAFKKDPIGNIGQLLAESLGAQTRAQLSYISKIPERATQGVLGATAAGAVAGGPAGAAAMVVPGALVGAGAGFAESQMLGSTANEYAGSVIESLKTSGVDVTNKEELQTALDDPEKMAKIRDKAYKKGVPVGIFDGLSAAIGGRIFSNPAKKLVGKAAQWAGEIGLQSLMGGAGETAGQLASEGQITSKKAILAEVLAEPASGAVEVGVNKALGSLAAARPDQQAKVSETQQKVAALQQSNAPLTAQALANSTADALVSEDPNLLSELVEQEAPEGTFVEEPTGDEKFAPPTTNLLPASTESVETPNELAQETPLESSQEAQVIPLQGVAPDSQGAVLGVGAQPTGAIAPVPGIPAELGIQSPVLEVAAEPSQITQPQIINEQPIPSPVGDVSQGPASAQPSVVVPPNALPVAPGDAVSASGATARHGGATNPAGVTPAAKPRSQSLASFTPEQNARHEAFVAQEPPPLERPEEATHFSSWAKDKKSIILENSEGQVAVITQSPKEDRKYQVTFMETGNAGIPEAFHDVPAQSVDEAVTEAYKRGFSDTKRYKNYERTGDPGRKEAVGPNPQSGLGQRPGELPGAPQEVRGKLPAPRVRIHAIERSTKALTQIEVDATPELEKKLKVHEGIYKLLVDCL